MWMNNTCGQSAVLVPPGDDRRAGCAVVYVNGRQWGTEGDGARSCLPVAVRNVPGVVLHVSIGHRHNHPRLSWACRRVHRPVHCGTVGLFGGTPAGDEGCGTSDQDDQPHDQHSLTGPIDLHNGHRAPRRPTCPVVPNGRSVFPKWTRGTGRRGRSARPLFRLWSSQRSALAGNRPTERSTADRSRTLAPRGDFPRAPRPRPLRLDGASAIGDAERRALQGRSALRLNAGLLRP